jgi:hypothetical protein
MSIVPKEVVGDICPECKGKGWITAFFGSPCYSVRRVVCKACDGWTPRAARKR